VKQMRALPSSDARNWITQASIHADHCPHGNWYFLPWHRAYLLALENIIVDLTQEPTLGIPYWNWTDDRLMPPAVAKSDIAGALYDDTRTMQPNQGLDGVLGAGKAEAIFGHPNMDDILANTVYQNFGSYMPTGQDSIDPDRWQRAGGRKAQLESQPHDYCHGAVGGHMGSVPVSARDPVFYMHHGNIDRTWAKWTQMGNLNESNVYWRTFKFIQNFWTADGSSKYDVQVDTLGSTLQLGYVYDDVPATVTTSLLMKQGTQESVRAESYAITKTALNVTLNNVAQATLSLPGQSQEVMKDVMTLRAAAPKRLYAFIDGISAPADKQVSVRVFLNCDYLTPDTPSSDPHYAGAFTFFVNPDHMDGGQSVAVDLTDAIEDLNRHGVDVGDELRVQLLATAFDGTPVGSAGFSVGSIEIAGL